METVSKIAKRVTPYLLAIVIELYLTTLAVGSLMALQVYKLQIGEHYSPIIKDLSLHPIKYATQYVEQRNPLFLVIAAGAVLYTLFLAIKWRNNRKKDWETADTDTHGSATWGSVKELMNEYRRVSPTNLAENFNKSIDPSVIQKLQEKGEQS